MLNLPCGSRAIPLVQLQMEVIGTQHEQKFLFSHYGDYISSKPLITPHGTSLSFFSVERLVTTTFGKPPPLLDSESRWFRTQKFLLRSSALSLKISIAQQVSTIQAVSRSTIYESIYGPTHEISSFVDISIIEKKTHNAINSAHTEIIRRNAGTGSLDWLIPRLFIHRHCAGDNPSAGAFMFTPGYILATV